MSQPTGDQNPQTPDEFAELDSLLGDQNNQPQGQQPQQPAEPVDWEKRAQSAEKFIRDLKNDTGAKSVKEIREKIAGAAPRQPAAPAPAASGDGQPQAADLSIKDVLRLRKENYTDEEILGLSEEANALGVPVSKLLDNPTFKAGIEQKRAKAKVEQANPAPTQRVAPVFEGKKDFKQLTPAERKKNWRGAIDQVRGRGKSSSE